MNYEAAVRYAIGIGSHASFRGISPYPAGVTNLDFVLAPQKKARQMKGISLTGISHAFHVTYGTIVPSAARSEPDRLTCVFGSDDRGRMAVSLARFHVPGMDKSLIGSGSSLKSPSYLDVS